MDDEDDLIEIDLSKIFDPSDPDDDYDEDDRDNINGISGKKSGSGISYPDGFSDDEDDFDDDRDDGLGMYQEL